MQDLDYIDYFIYVIWYLIIFGKYCNMREVPHIDHRSFFFFQITLMKKYLGCSKFRENQTFTFNFFQIMTNQNFNLLRGRPQENQKHISDWYLKRNADLFRNYERFCYSKWWPLCGGGTKIRSKSPIVSADIVLVIILWWLKF